jgi:hypothetical protein
MYRVARTPARITRAVALPSKTNFQIASVRVAIDE